MLRVNHCSRYNLADIAVELVCEHSPNHPISADANRLQMNWRHDLRLHEKFVNEHGEDPEWCAQIPKIEVEGA